MQNGDGGGFDFQAVMEVDGDAGSMHDGTLDSVRVTENSDILPGMKVGDVEQSAYHPRLSFEHEFATRSACAAPVAIKELKFRIAD